MKMIADSGSTKTAWRLIDAEGGVQSVETEGLNPFYQESAEMVATLKESLLPYIKGRVNEVFFYGAGCANEEKCAIVSNALREVFPGSTIEVASDLVGAAHAVCGHESGIACILGTGSNSCYYDGEEVKLNVSPLGLILGDEGSGGVIGRKVVADYLKEMMPGYLREKFETMYHLSAPEIMDRVYRKPYPNRFLAQFTRFLNENITEPYCSHLVEESFREFVQRNLVHYPNYKNLPVNFAGSVAWYFSEQLEKVLKEEGLNPGRIVRDPIEALVDYHS
jgi:N-acetylglucosamine kinase-like BadF-type ATPase